MDIFNKYVSKDKQILDIGCGYGRILKELYDNGHAANGIYYIGKK